MHILLNVAQASGIQDNSYGWRLVWTVVFTLTMGGEILLGRYLESSSVGAGTLHACTGDVVEGGAEAAAGWRTVGWVVSWGDALCQEGPVSAFHCESLLCKRGLLGDAFVLMTSKFGYNI